MKLLLDENLSRRLAVRLQDLYSGSIHVAAAGLLDATDYLVWEYAKSEQFTIVTADADFYELATGHGLPPKVIWLRGRDYPTATAEAVIRSQAARLAEFGEDPERALLVLEQW